MGIRLQEPKKSKQPKIQREKLLFQEDYKDYENKEKQREEKKPGPEVVNHSDSLDENQFPNKVINKAIIITNSINEMANNILMALNCFISNSENHVSSFILHTKYIPITYQIIN